MPKYTNASLGQQHPASLCIEPKKMSQAVLTDGIVKIENWKGSENDFVEIGRMLGPLEKANRKDPKHRGELFRVDLESGTLGVGGYWHADGFAKTTSPAKFTIYHVAAGASSETPTYFVDAELAASELQENLLKKIKNTKWTHSSGSQHPFLLTNHRRRTTVLSVNLGKMTSVEGLTEFEMINLVALLSDYLDRQPVYTHFWKPGDLLIVDNHRILHKSSGKKDPNRELWRVSVLNSSPTTEAN